MRRFTRLVLAAALCACAADSTQPGQQNSGGNNNGNGNNSGGSPAWVLGPNMLTGHTLAASVVLNDKFYVISGQVNSSWTDANDVFDGTAKTWSSKSPIPHRRGWSGTNAATANGLIYAVDGNPPGDCTNLVEVYDPARDAWAQGVNAPLGRCHAAAVGVGSQIYVFGGWDASSTQRFTQVDVFDAVAKTWSRGDALPAWRGGMGAAAVGATIYLIGGTTAEGACVNSVIAYDISARTWSNKAPLPQGLCSPAVTVANGRIYAIGGQINGGSAVTNAVESYDPTSDSWRTEPAIQTARVAAAAGTIGCTIVVAGGGNPSTTLNTTELLPLSGCTPPPALTLQIASGSGQTGVVGTTLPQPLIVRASTSTGAVAQGQTVAWSVSGGGTASSSVTTTDATGTAQIQLKLGSALGTETVTASLVGASAPPVSFTETAIAGDVASISITPATATIEAGGQVAFSAKQADAFGNPTSAPVQWSSSSTGVATISATGLASGVAPGTATITAIAGGKAATATLTVVAPLPAFDEFPILVTPKQDYAAAAASDGSNYLVTTLQDVGAGVGDTTRVHVVSTSGVIGSPVALGPSNGDMPVAAFDGARYLVMYRLASSSTRADLWGRFVGRDGVASGAPFPITSTTDASVLAEGLAYGNGTYLGVYTRVVFDSTVNDSLYATFARPISASGVIGAEQKLGSNAAMVAVDFDGTNFLAIYAKSGNPKELRGRIITPSGTQVSDFLIAQSTTVNYNVPQWVAFSGGNHLVVYGTHTLGGTGLASLTAQLVSPAGSLVGAGTNVPITPGSSAVTSLVPTSSGFALSWQEGAQGAHSTRAELFFANGAPQTGAVTIFAPDARFASMSASLFAAPSGKFLAVIQQLDNKPGATLDVYGKLIGIP